MFTTKEVAEIFETSIANVQKACRDGKLKTRKIGKNFLILKPLPKKWPYGKYEKKTSGK